MNNKKGIVILIIGLILVGIGSFYGFEKYDDYLTSKNIKKIYTGVYKSENNYLSINEEEKNTLKITIGEESYIFTKNEDVYDNTELKYSVKIENDKLTLIKNGQDIELYYKEK